MTLWKCVGAAVVGTSHKIAGLPCQDTWLAWLPDNAAPDRNISTAAIFVSDGAGSAIKGEIGSRIAVDVAYSWLEEETVDFSAAYAKKIILAIQKAIAEQAEFDGLKSRDYACTLLGLMAEKNKILLFQIGDGAIVIDHGNGFILPIPPMNGEYVSSTYFTTDSDAVETMRTVSLNCSVKRAAILTDGLERLALDMASKTPFAPFFKPLFDTLEKIDSEQLDAAEKALIDFLDSEKVNSRTDDDKTLVLLMDCKSE